MSLENETASCKPAGGGCSRRADELIYVSVSCTSVAQHKFFVYTYGLPPTRVCLTTDLHTC